MASNDLLLRRVVRIYIKKIKPSRKHQYIIKKIMAPMCEAYLGFYSCKTILKWFSDVSNIITIKKNTKEPLHVNLIYCYRNKLMKLVDCNKQIIYLTLPTNKLSCINSKLHKNMEQKVIYINEYGREIVCEVLYRNRNRILIDVSRKKLRKWITYRNSKIRRYPSKKQFDTNCYIKIDKINYYECIDDCEMSNKKRSKILTNRGICHFMLKNYNECIDDCGSAYEIYKNWQNYFFRGSAYEKLHEYTKAKKEFSSMLNKKFQNVPKFVVQYVKFMESEYKYDFY